MRIQAARRWPRDGFGPPPKVPIAEQDVPPIRTKSLCCTKVRRGVPPPFRRGRSWHGRQRGIHLRRPPRRPRL
jgi:hypothetical protein